MAQSAFFFVTFVIAGSVFQLVRLWDSSIETQLVRIRRDRKLLKQKQQEARQRRQDEYRRQYRSNQSHDRQQYRRSQERQQSQPCRPSVSNRVFYGEILGIEVDAEMTDIKKTYRKMVAKYHPDKVQHLGREFQELAEKKIKELNEAYDFFKRKYQFT